MGDVGYWIDPQGETHPIQHRSHHRWMRAHRGMSDDAAEERGWHRVRVVPEGELFSYGRVGLTDSQNEAIRRLMREHRAVHHQECTVVSTSSE